MPKAIRIHKLGAPSVLTWEEVPIPEPADNEVLIKQSAVGLNFLDIHLRNGSIPTPTTPFIPGMEGSGVVIRAGKNTQYASVGDRVAYAMGPVGAYAEYRVIPEAFLVRVPHDLAHEQVAASLLRGLMAHTLVKRVYAVNKTTNVLVHAAAGGVGSLVCQWAKYLGARVIGTVGSDEKMAAAKEFGCDHVINRTREDVAALVRKHTDGMALACW
jgi:NADPH2:quinone reductase